MPGDPPALDLAVLLDVAPAGLDEESISDGTQRMTWGEYRAAAAGLAGRLAELGLGSGDRIGVHLPKSVDSFVAVHAVLRSGATMVPLDRFAPGAIVADVAADATLRAVITDRDVETDLFGGETAFVDPRERATERPPAAVSLGDPAYIIYTSGSTGRPKGIVHTHASGLAYARRAAATYGLRSDDMLANFAPLHFDQSTFELYAAPYAGASVVVVPDAVLRFPASVAALVFGERCTVLYTVPYAITQLLDRGGIERHDTSAVRWVLFGGESFEPTRLERAMRALPTARFSNVYGPAEVNQCTFRHLESPDEVGDVVPIGRPWAGTEIRLGDVGGDRQSGELLVATDTMMAGYWNRPDLTDRAIDLVDGVRWYRTGDLVTVDATGELVFEGRVDHQVKVRGHRIELEAVELAASTLPGVDSVAAVAFDDRLIVFVSPPADDDRRRALARGLRGMLPPNAVPDEIVGLPAMPRTGTGKVDRAAALAEWREGASGGGVEPDAE